VEEEDGGALVGGALKALKQALERAWDLVVACQRKNAVLRALEADAIAEKLRRVCLDVSLNLSAVVLAKIMEIVAAIPDAHLHLRQQVRACVCVCVCLYAELLYVLQLEYIYRLSYLNLFLY
jgi:hypothetical protein